LPAGSFTDIDQGDVLTFTALLSDSSPLPIWLAFDPITQTFSGDVPLDAAGFIDIQVAAADGPLPADFAGLIASDTFRLNFLSEGGGDGHGNEGVGNGEDPPPPGHDDDFNDGPGTGPGHPGAQNGRGLGHSRSTEAPGAALDPNAVAHDRLTERLSDSIAHWFDEAIDATPIRLSALDEDGARSISHGSDSQIREGIATSWRRVQMLLDAHLAYTDAAALGSEEQSLSGLLSGPQQTLPMVARPSPVSGHDLRQLQGLNEGLSKIGF
jgi:hypothetical protein